MLYKNRYQYLVSLQLLAIKPKEILDIQEFCYQGNAMKMHPT